MYASISDGVSTELAGARAGYRREFEEMESRIKKCERQRAELERQFGELMRERAESERTAARAMKQRHKRLMEAERQRAERNESILRMLNKIDQQAASLAAKTDRLKMLKTQYEMYLMRAYSSAQPPSITASNPPMIAAPPMILPKAPQSPSKSGFAQYLSDLTHQQQQASIDPIPPPTALSNYLAAQQKPFNQPSYGAPVERPYSRMFDRGGVLWEADQGQRRPQTAGSDVAPLPTANGGAKAKRFEMSNEDFIRYIDSEVLKEPLPTVSVVAPSPEVGRKEQQVQGAYLEDAGMSEDEQRGAGAIDRLAEDVQQFSIVVKENVPKNDEWKDIEDGPPVRQSEERENTKSVALNQVAGKSQSLLKPTIENAPDYPAKEQDYSSKIEPPGESESTAEFKEIDQQGHNLVDRIESHVKEYYEVPQEVVDDRPMEASQLDQAKEQEYIANYASEPTENTFQQQMVYRGEEHGSLQAYSDQPYQAPNAVEPKETIAHAAEDNLTEGMHLSSELKTGQQYNPEQNDPNNELYTEAQQFVQQPQPVQQFVQQPTAGGQRWSTARQAMRSKAFPGAAFKPPSPEMNIPAADVTEESYKPTYETDTAPESKDIADPNAVQGYYEGGETGGSVEKAEQNAEVYPEYATGTNEQNYYEPNSATGEPTVDQQQTSPAVGYPEDGMGQPVEYQTGQDGQQTAMYQYQQAEGQQVTYQEGQYVEGASADPHQYQYAEGVEQTVAPYGTQEGYQDPNQQYQYDQTAYFDQQQQQQGYEGQYYNEDPQQQQQQQQQQQYYMADPNQQQEANYEQQNMNQQQQDPSVDNYQPSDQGYYPTDAEYEPSVQQTAPADGADQTPATVKPIELESSKVGVTPDVGSVESTPVAEAAPPKDNKGKKGSNVQSTIDSKPAKKDPEPASDTPTMSTVNDESDFDFSTQ